MRLYRAYSKVDNYQGRDDVIFQWYAVDRDIPVAPYEELVEGWAELDQASRDYSASYVLKLLTEQEVESLRAYLNRAHSGLTLWTEEEQLPVSSDLAHATNMGIGGLQDVYTMSLEDGYDLPIEIWAYYDMRLCPPSRQALARRIARLEAIVEGRMAEGPAGSDGQPTWLSPEDVARMEQLKREADERQEPRLELVTQGVELEFYAQTDEGETISGPEALELARKRNKAKRQAAKMAQGGERRLWPGPWSRAEYLAHTAVRTIEALRAELGRAEGGISQDQAARMSRAIDALQPYMPATAEDDIPF